LPQRYQVEFYLWSDGQYACHAIHATGQMFPCFYYGTDDESPRKIIKMEDSQNAIIEIVFDDKTSIRGQLKEFHINAATGALEFKFYNTFSSKDRSYGPLSFVLNRNAKYAESL